MDVAVAPMDTAIWSDVPEDLLEIMLSLLPVRSLVTFQAVCKKWNEIILSNKFLCRRRLQSVCKHSRNPTLFTFLEKGNQAFWIYDSTSNKWYARPLSLSNCLPIHKVCVKASAGGLVCGIIQQSYGEFHYFVCNPVLKKLKVLPPVKVRTKVDPLMNIVIDRSSCMKTQYKVIVIGSGYKGTVWNSRAMAIYDSSTDEWDLFDVPTNPLQWQYLNKSTICNGILYLCFDYRYFDGMHFFDIQKGLWDPSEVYLSPRSIKVRVSGCLDSMNVELPQVKFPMIAESGGKLLVVGLPLHDNPDACAEGLTVWALAFRDSEATWQEISRMPPQMFKRYILRAGFTRYWCDFDVIAHGDIICLCTHTNPTNILAFNISENLWYPLRDGNCLIDRVRVLRAHEFQPCLEDLVDSSK